MLAIRIEKWHEATADNTTLRNCCYWWVGGGELTENSNSKTIRIPRSKRRGKPSNHRLPPGVRALALSIVRQRYVDFGPTFWGTEKLAEHHGCSVSHEGVGSGYVRKVVTSRSRVGCPEKAYLLLETVEAVVYLVGIMCSLATIGRAIFGHSDEPSAAGLMASLWG